MRAPQRKTLSSVFVITAVIVVSCLTAAPRALAQEGTSPFLSVAGQGSEQAILSGAHLCFLDEHPLKTLLGLIALAAYLRTRIEWIKKICQKENHAPAKRIKNVLPAAIIETIFATAGFLLVLRICITRLDGPSPVCLDWVILRAIVLGFCFLAVLLGFQWREDITWMCGCKDRKRLRRKQQVRAEAVT